MIYEMIAGAGTDWVGGQEHVSAGFHHMGDDTMTSPRQFLLHMHSIYLSDNVYPAAADKYKTGI